MTRLNALEGKGQKSENSLKIVGSNQHIVMNEEFVKNSVLNAKVDPTVVMEVSIIQIWWMEQFTAEQTKFIASIYG